MVRLAYLQPHGEEWASLTKSTGQTKLTLVHYREKELILQTTLASKNRFVKI